MKHQFECCKNFFLKGFDASIIHESNKLFRVHCYRCPAHFKYKTYLEIENNVSSAYSDQEDGDADAETSSMI